MTPYRYTDQLESPRLITRLLTPDDIEPWSHFFADKEAIELFPDFGLSTNEAKAKHWIDRQLNRYATQQYGLQALIEKTTGRFIGQCGLLTQEVDGTIETEVGYHIFKQYWGQGFAPEAAKLFIDYAFTNDLTSSVISIIDIRNDKSMRVAEKNGLVREKQTRWNYLDIYIYRTNRKQ
jgi:[ribosomal protein S5]-alanine N-acetyltransferase